MLKNPVLLLLLLVTACQLPTTDYGENEKEKQPTPDQVADSIEVIYSEDGILKLKLRAPILVTHDQEEKYNEFPEGLKVLFYDQKGEENAELTAKFGYDNQQKRNRYVKDSVVIISKKDGWIYSTEELYIDDVKDSVYNNGKYVKLTQPDGTIIQGYGFTSDTRMEKIYINNVFDSALPVEEKQGEIAGNDSTTVVPKK